MFGSPNRYFKENSRWVPLKRGAPLSSLAMTEFGNQTNICLHFWLQWHISLSFSDRSIKLTFLNIERA